MEYKGYRCFDPTTKKVNTSRHVHFHEHKFPYRALVSPVSAVPYTSPLVLTWDWSPTNVTHELPSTLVHLPVSAHVSASPPQGVRLVAALLPRPALLAPLIYPRSLASPVPLRGLLPNTLPRQCSLVQQPLPPRFVRQLAPSGVLLPLNSRLVPLPTSTSHVPLPRPRCPCLALPPRLVCLPLLLINIPWLPVLKMVCLNLVS